MRIDRGVSLLALDGLLPGLIGAAADFKAIDNFKVGLIPIWYFPSRYTQTADRSLDDLKKADLHREARITSRIHEALGLHETRFRSRLLGAESRRIKHAKVPALLVFDRGRPVRIEHVALVEDGFGNPFDGSKIHERTASSAASMRSSACSHVGMPCCILY